MYFAACQALQGRNQCVPNPQKGVYSRSGRSSFSLTVADNDGDDQLWFIHDGTESDSKSISEFTTFVYRSRNFSVDVRGETAWSRESGDQVLESGVIEAVVREELREGALNPESGQDCGRTVSW